MFSESYIYKDELLKYANDLIKRKEQRKWFDRSYLLIEKEIFFGFFIVRKLCESFKISNYLKSKNYNVGKITLNLPFELNLLNNYKVLDYIDLEAIKETRMNIKKICNQFIHSYYFFILSEEYNRNKSILISSDYFKTKSCLIININIIIGIFKEFGENYPKSLKYKLDHNGRQRTILE